MPFKLNTGVLKTSIALLSALFSVTGCLLQPGVKPSSEAAAAKTSPLPATPAHVDRNPAIPSAPSPNTDPAPPQPPPDYRIFTTGSRNLLDNETLRELARIAKRVQEEPGTALSIESYSSWQGSRELNMALAQKRAETVKNALIKLGLPEGRVITTAYGEERKTDATAKRVRIDLRLITPKTSEHAPNGAKP